MLSNFMVQDLFGSFLAFFLYASILFIPGYVLGWLLNLFDFRMRVPAVRYLLGIVLSNAISPIVLFLTYRFLGATSAITLILGLVITWVWLEFIWRSRKSSEHTSLKNREYQKMVLLIGAAWVVFSVFLLVDIQLGERLYFNVASYDYTTRVAVIDAITRTGVPPVNPGYYPGQPVLLTMLYYFWYILGSFVDQVGGSWVSPQQAMIASVAWSGLGLMATMALYLRLRNSNRKIGSWRAAILAPQLLLVSGLDAIPVITISLTGRIVLGFNPLDGHIEGWNMPVMSWLNALAWVPHHVAGALACLTAMLLFLYAINVDRKQLPFATVVSGLAFASAVGLSMWTMFVFAFFWILWMGVLLFRREDIQVIFWMFAAAILGVILVSPFLAGVLKSDVSGGSSSGLPVGLFIRPFIISSFFSPLPQWAIALLNLLFLPLNYLFELGFYFMIMLLWFQARKNEWKNNPYFLVEVLLFLTVVILLSFLHSTIIVINDLGIRGWLFGQFILVIWAVDILEEYLGNRNTISPTLFQRFPRIGNLGAALSLMFVVGILTTSLEIISIRAWPIFIDLGVAGFPTGLSEDTQLGRRTYSARLAYEFVAENVREDTVIQYNPMEYLDRPSGLYGNHQMAIADRTSYGVNSDELKFRIKAIGSLFQGTEALDLIQVDSFCDKYSIDVLVVKDIDPLWQQLDNLATKRPALYKNSFYAIFPCGHYSNKKP